MLSRRDLLRSLALVPIISGISVSQDAHSKQFSHTSEEKTCDRVNAQVQTIPYALERGDTIAITAPASPASSREISGFVSLMRTYGINCDVGKTITSSRRETRYLSAGDEMRAQELMSFFQDDKIKGIVCARGGYGVMRILNMLDYNLIKKQPKILIGYSDITALLIAINQKSNLVCFHGPVASSNYNKFTLDYFLPLFLKNFRKPELTFQSLNMQTIIPGITSGQLTGGNLTMIASTVGTPFEIDTRNKILFLEETHEDPYKIDRLLMQLKLAGKFDCANGIIIGNFDNLAGKLCPYYTKGTMQVIKNVLGDLKIPILAGDPFGHMRNKITLPLGINATIDSEQKIFTINETAIF